MQKKGKFTFIFLRRLEHITVEEVARYTSYQSRADEQRRALIAIHFDRQSSKRKRKEREKKERKRERKEREKEKWEGRRKEDPCLHGSRGGNNGKKY